MEILKEMYFGNISEYDRKRKINPELQEREVSLHDELQKILADNGDKLEDFIDIIYQSTDEDIVEAFVRGVKIGIHIGLEVSEINF